MEDDLFGPQAWDLIHALVPLEEGYIPRARFWHRAPFVGDVYVIDESFTQPDQDGTAFEAWLTITRLGHDEPAEQIEMRWADFVHDVLFNGEWRPLDDDDEDDDGDEP